MKRISFAGMVLLLSAAVNAQSNAIFAPNGKAIKGYDVVAFFSQHQPVMGVDSLAFDWQGAHWLFASRDDLKAFTANPTRYAPQYGGYCAYGVSQGHKAPTMVETWTIVDDKLYFNYNKSVKETWVKNEQALIQQADKQWPDLEAKK